MSNATLSNTSISARSASGSSTSQPQTTLTPSNLQQGPLALNSNSRGDYVTTSYVTGKPVYTIPSGFTQTEDYGSGIVLVGPTTWSTQWVLPALDVANDLNTTSSNAPTPGIFLLNGKNKSVKASLISYGREPACTSAFLSYAAANPWYTVTGKSAGTITLSDGQTTVAVVYSTLTLPITSAPHCCGTCSIYFNNLQMLYWPAPRPNTACLGIPSASLKGTSTSAGNTATNQSIYATDSDGYV